jgi:hypothetical protein
MSIDVDLHEFMYSIRPKVMKNSNNFFKRQSKMHPNYVLWKISVGVSIFLPPPYSHEDTGDLGRHGIFKNLKE